MLIAKLNANCFRIYKAVSFNYNEIKFWLGASLKPPGEPEQQWIWSNQVPVTWVNWISPPPEIRYEPVDKTAESCGLGWAQKSSQKNGWLKTKCNSNGDVATICQFKPGKRKKVDMDEGENPKIGQYFDLN